MLLVPRLFENTSFQIHHVMEGLTNHRKVDIVESDPAENLLMQDRETVFVRRSIIREVGGEDGTSSPEGEDA
jgi:hypothetical protein